MSALILSLRDVTKSYGKRTVLRDLSFDLAPGERMLLLGRSGSGKSTLLNVICGLVTPDSGTVTIAGEAIASGSAAARDDIRRRRLGIVFQTLRLVSALDVRGNLLLAQKLSGQPADGTRVDALIDRLGLANRARARPRELSQGEAQRAAIARALVGAPDLLIADEPTSALDDYHAESVGRLLLDVTAEHGAALLVATHDARLRSLIARRMTLEPAP